MSAHELAADIPPEHGLTRWTGWACDLAGLLLVLMLLLIGAEILVRTGFKRSTMVADEFSGYLFVWVTMLGFAHALQTGAFLRVDHLVARFGPRGRAASLALSALCGVAVTAICAQATGQLVFNSWSFDVVSIQPSATPLFLPQLVLPVGFVLLALIYLSQAVLAARAALRGPGTPS